MSQNDFESLLSFIENTNNKTIIINTPKGGTPFEELIEGFVLDNCTIRHDYNYENSYTITPQIDSFLKFKNGIICDRRGYVYEKSEIKKNKSEIIGKYNNPDKIYHSIENNPKRNRYNLYIINDSHEYQKLNPVKYSTGQDVQINDTVTYEYDENNYMYKITNINLHDYMVEIVLKNIRTEATLKIYETGPISKLTFKGTYTPTNYSKGPQQKKHSIVKRGGKSRKSHHRLKRQRLRTRRRHTHRLRQRNR